jgi:hypothetical protein
VSFLKHLFQSDFIDCYILVCNKILPKIAFIASLVISAAASDTFSAPMGVCERQDNCRQLNSKIYGNIGLKMMVETT